MNFVRTWFYLNEIGESLEGSKQRSDIWDLCFSKTTPAAMLRTTCRKARPEAGRILQECSSKLSEK